MENEPLANSERPHHFCYGLFAREVFFMSITVQIPTALRRLAAGTPRVVCSAANLSELFSELDRQFPDLKPHLRDEAGETRRFLNIYVNEEDIRFLGGASYGFQDGDEVLLVPSIAGGSR
jgi:sulfur-carrier protein